MNDPAALGRVPGSLAFRLPWLPGRAGVSTVTRTSRRRYFSLLALLLGAAALYLWGLGASGWANGYYSAAVQAGSTSWKAFLFGSFDASNFVTVDKPPASLWVMDLSARLFGVNAWSILVPQALMGLAAVALLYATVRRHFGHAAGLIAGAVLAVTPVATLMFRFNNPDALLVLLLVAAGYAMSRAVEAGKTRWLVLAGVLVGFGFLTKMLQAFVVLPVFAGVYAFAAPVRLRTRMWQLLIGGIAVVVSAGWWVALVALWPASDRPYIGGSADNSILNLIFGYNGFGRISGNEAGSVGGAGGPGGWGPTGWDRMFNSSYGGQISWLIPAALIALGSLLALRARVPRVDAQRAMTLLWGGWLLLTGVVFSFAQGIIHEYYTVALAPAIGALVGMGAVTLWAKRSVLPWRLLMAAAVLATTVWSFVLLDRSPAWLPSLRGAILAAGVGSSIAVATLPLLRRTIVVLMAGAALFTLFAGSLAYSIDTALTPHSGALPLAGPAVLDAQRGPGGGPGGVAFANGPPPAGFGGGFGR
ncbi:MAG TPA: glycosyltransferase family 39 protein, partial [Candidatus Dormibacteraeota bacterium]|nr:glycosyltransferase family 39 protein [Candidatus Dormibacteraeota bacterium]